MLLMVKSKENNHSRSLFSIYANQRVFELEYAFQSNLPTATIGATSST